MIFERQKRSLENMSKRLLNAEALRRGERILEMGMGSP